MPKNKKGGNKAKKRKNTHYVSSEIHEKEDGQEYALIKKCQGNCRFIVLCSDGTERKATLCGAMRKRNFVKTDQIVLVSLRDFQDSICDIIDSYDDHQAQKLQKMGHLPDFMKSEESFQDSELMNIMSVSSEEEILLDDI